MLTHTHADHWDQIAQQTVPKAMPIFVQHAQDAQTVREQGFTKVEILKNGTRFANVELFRTGGQHGTDLLYAMPQMKQMLGEAMGIVFKYDGAPTIYVAGDTIWRPSAIDAVVAPKAEGLYGRIKRLRFLALHGLEEFVVGFGHLQFVDEEFHRFGFTHWVNDFAKDPHFLELFLRSEQLFATGA